MFSSAVLACLLVVFTLSEGDVRAPPSITEQSEKSIIFRLDTPVELKCEATGDPKPEYEWFKDGNEVDLNSGITRLEEGNIRINSATSVREGWYQCKAFNSHGTALTVTTFLQRARLTYDQAQDVTDIALEVGQSFMLPPDPVISVPKEVYKWKIATDLDDDSPTNLAISRRVSVDDEGILYFANVEQDDDMGGKIYKCDVKIIPLDQTLGGTYRRLQVSDATQGYGAIAPMKPKEDTTVVALKGQTARLKCFFAGYPTPSVKWEGSPESQPGIDLQDYETFLVISDVQYSHEKDYRCYGENSNGRSSPVNIHLKVESVPEFTTDGGPQDKTGRQGESLSFTCDTDARPAASVTWYINGVQVLASNPGAKRSISSDGKTITFSDLCKETEYCGSRPADLLSLQCNASNVHGYAYTSAALNVILPTTIETKPVDVELAEDQTIVQFDCSASADDSQELSIVWWHDKLMIYPDTDPRYTIEVVDDVSSLFINVTDASRDDLEKYIGKYICKAQAGLSGEASHEAIFSVPGVTTPAPVTASVADFWWVFLIVAIVILILITILLCYVCIKRNKGDDYLVDDKERKAGYDPEKELVDSGFHEHFRPELMTSSRENLRPDSTGWGELGDIVKNGDQPSIISSGIIPLEGPPAYSTLPRGVNPAYSSDPPSRAPSREELRLVNAPATLERPKNSPNQRRSDYPPQRVGPSTTPSSGHSRNTTPQTTPPALRPLSHATPPTVRPQSHATPPTVRPQSHATPPTVRPQSHATPPTMRPQSYATPPSNRPVNHSPAPLPRDYGLPMTVVPPNPRFKNDLMPRGDEESELGDDDSESLEDYQMEPTLFNEDGSFIGQYNEANKRRRAALESNA